MGSDASKPTWQEDLITWIPPISMLVATVISVLTLIPPIWRPVALILGAWCACLYVRCSRQKGPIVVGSKKGRYVFSENMRTIAFIALVALPSFLLGALLGRFVDIIPATSILLASPAAVSEAQTATAGVSTLTPPSVTLTPSLTRTPVSTPTLAMSPVTPLVTEIPPSTVTPTPVVTPTATPTMALPTMTPTATETAAPPITTPTRALPTMTPTVIAAEPLAAVQDYRLPLAEPISVVWDGTDYWAVFGDELVISETGIGGIRESLPYRRDLEVARGWSAPQ